MKKMSVDEAELLSQLHRWRDEAEKRADCRVSRICVAYEAGRDGFWLARCLRGSGIEAHVMHSTSIPVKRDHRQAKTDRLDCQLMMRAFPGWLRREEGHCRMVAVPTARQEDARRVTRERKGLVREQTKLINRLKAMFACLGIRNFKPHLKKAPERLDGLLTPEGDPIRSRRTPLPKFDVPWIGWSLSGRRSRRSKIHAQRRLPRRRPLGITPWSGSWRRSMAWVSTRLTCW